MVIIVGRFLDIWPGFTVVGLAVAIVDGHVSILIHFAWIQVMFVVHQPAIMQRDVTVSQKPKARIVDQELVSEPIPELVYQIALIGVLGVIVQARVIPVDIVVPAMPQAVAQIRESVLLELPNLKPVGTAEPKPEPVNQTVPGGLGDLAQIRESVLLELPKPVVIAELKPAVQVVPGELVAIRMPMVLLVPPGPNVVLAIA